MCDCVKVNNKQIKETRKVGVDENSIQRDIDDIRVFFDEKYYMIELKKDLS